MSEIVDIKAQLLLAQQLPVLCWMVQGRDLLLLHSNDSGHSSQALHPLLTHQQH